MRTFHFLTDRHPAERHVRMATMMLIWSSLVCFMVAIRSSGAADPKDQAKPRTLPKMGIKRYESSVFPLSTTEVSNNMPEGFCGSLARELIRQALLVSAREEFGLRTLDSSIGELAYESNSPEAYPFQLDIRFDPIPNNNDQFAARIELARPNAAGEWFAYTLHPIRFTIVDKLESIAEEAERLSRNEFVEALQSAGFEKAAAKKPSGKISQIPEGHLDSIAQFSFLQQVHADRQSHGESPQNLGSLIRGYANLGSLIDYHWGSASKAYRARSLIYANRLLAKYESTPFSLAHRAYARALTGTHLTAIKDINAAHDSQGEPAPDWLPLIKAFCEYDPKTLKRADGHNQELALYLRMRQIDPHFDKDTGLGVIEDFMRVNPSSLLALELMCEMGERDLIRRITEGGADRMWPQIYARLAEAPHLPANTLALAKQLSNSVEQVSVEREHRARTEVIADLQHSGDADIKRELSWRALAELIDDASFVQVWRAVLCNKIMLAVPDDHTIQRLYPLVKRHRLARCIQSYSSDAGTVTTAIEELSKSTDSVTIELPSVPFANWAYRTNPNFYYSLNTLYRRHVDDIYSDLANWFSLIPEFQLSTGPRLKLICPYQPRVMSSTIWDMPKLTKEQADELESRYSDNAFVILTLGQKHIAMGHSSNGVRYLLKSLKVAPTYNTYILLADEYWHRGDDDAAIAAYEKALDFPGHDHDNSLTHAKIAERLMHQGKWEEANKHALQVANSSYAFGFSVAARCAEGLEDWETAEQFYRAMAEHYESDCYKWLQFCVRRNRGDRDAAFALCRAWWNSLKTPYTQDETWSRAIGAIAENDLKTALKVLMDKKNKWINDEGKLLVASVISEKLGDNKRRDACYRQIDVNCDPTNPLPTLVHLFRSAIKSDGFHWNRQSFDELTADACPLDLTFAYYCAGMFMELHGEHELAIEYLQIAATSEDVDLYGTVLACLALNELKVPIGRTRLNIQPDAWIPSIKKFENAREAYREHRLDDSIKLYEAAYQLRPEFLLAKIHVAQIQIEQKDYASAIKHLEEVLEKNPDCETAHNKLVEIYAGSEKVEFRDGPKALEHAQYAFDHRTTKTWFNYSTLAAARSACKEFDEAVRLMRKAVKLNPEDGNLKTVLANYRKGKPYWSHKEGSPD